MLEANLQLSYNWTCRPKDEVELTVRNTFLNSQTKVTNHSSEKRTKKQKKRVSWQIDTEQHLLDVQQQPYYEKKESSFHEKVMKSVRRIISEKTIPLSNDTGRQELLKHKSSCNLNTVASLRLSLPQDKSTAHP